MEMKGAATAKPGARKFANQRAGWKVPVFTLLCLLQAAHALKGPSLVPGEPGGAVTVRCHYPPSAVNRHQRKYWCRLSSMTRFCHTVVSSSRYTHIHYRDRVSLTDFPQRGLFVVRLSLLSLGDAGSYRCGIGNRNNMLFISMKLTMSAGPYSTVPSVTPAAGKLAGRSPETASPAATRWTPGTTQTTERQGTGWDRGARTPGSRTRTASMERRRSPGPTGVSTTGTGGHVAMSTWATVPTPESLPSTIRGVRVTPTGVWVRGTRSPVANQASASEEGRETAATEDAQPRGATLDADWMVTGTLRPPSSVSEPWLWETPQEARLASEPQAPGSIERIAPAACVWALGFPGREMASVEESPKGELDPPAGDGDPPTMPSRDPAAEPLRPQDKGSSMKSSFSGGSSMAWILTAVPTALFLLLALVLLQRKLRRQRTSQGTDRAAGVTLIQMTHFLEPSLQPDPLAHAEREPLRGDCPGEGP